MPFGEEITSSIGSRNLVTGYGGADSTRQKFTSKERDNESGLDYFGARYYSSAQGRFTSVDPENIGADSEDPQSWNGYAYVRNSPFLFVDPDGQEFLVVQSDGSSSILTDEEFYDVRRRAEKEGFKFTGDRDFFEGGDVVSPEGNVIASYQQISIDETGRDGKARKLAYEMREYLNDIRNYIPVAGRFIKKIVFARNRARSLLQQAARARTPPKPRASPLEIDATGKVHGDLPNQVPKNWTREQLEDSQDALKTSIQNRKDEQIRRGEEGRHRRRIGKEERLLRKVEKKLGGS